MGDNYYSILSNYIMIWNNNVSIFVTENINNKLRNTIASSQILLGTTIITSIVMYRSEIKDIEERNKKICKDMEFINENIEIGCLDVFINQNKDTKGIYNETIFNELKRSITQWTKDKYKNYPY